MLVAISGSQGSGKSTILQEIKKLGYNIIERKTSRSIQDEWGVNREDIIKDIDLTRQFQDEILSRKVADERTAVDSKFVVWFTERTYADLFAYALDALGKYNEQSDWIDMYYKKCMHHNQNYDLVYYLRAGQFNVVQDGVRGANKHYSRMVDLAMLDFTEQMTHTSRLTLINTPDLEQRVNIIINQANSMLGTNRNT